MYEQPFNPFAKNLAVVKDYFKSGSVLVLAVARAAIVLLSLITALIGPSSASSIMNSLSKSMSDLGMSAEYTESLSQSVFAANSVISYIPTIAVSLLVVAALLIIYFKSRNPSPSSTPKAGVTILYVLAVISMVSMIILAVLSVFAIGVLIWAAATQAGSQLSSEPIKFVNPSDGREYQIAIDSGMLTAIAVATSVFIVIFMVIVLIYVVNTKRYYGSIRASISTVELQNRGAKAYGVFNVIFAVFLGLSLLSIPSSFISIPALNLDGMGIAALVVSSLLQIVNFVAIVLEGRIALGYKKYIDEVKYGYSRPIPPAAPYAPFPGGAQGYQPPQAAPYQNNTNNYTPNANTYADPYGAAPAPKPQAAPACPKCGAPVDPNSSFCGNCGTKL